MKPLNRFITVGFVFGLSALAMAQDRATPERVTKNLSSDAIEIPNTRSPDGKVALFSVYLDGSTVAVAALVTTDRKQCLAVGSSHPYGANIRDRSPKSYLTVLWSTNSMRVAIHDSASKHSRLEVFSLNPSGTSQVQLPDLFALMLREGVVTSNAPSSGQEPLQWFDDRHLLLEFRARTEAGATVIRRRVLDAEDGKIELRPEGMPRYTWRHNQRPVR